MIGLLPIALIQQLVDQLAPIARFRPIMDEAALRCMEVLHAQHYIVDLSNPLVCRLLEITDLQQHCHVAGQGVCLFQNHWLPS